MLQLNSKNNPSKSIKRNLVSTIKVENSLTDEAYAFYDLTEESLKVDCMYEILMRENVLKDLVKVNINESLDVVRVVYKFCKTIFLTNSFVDELNNFENFLRSYSGFIEFCQKENEIRVSFYEKNNYTVISA